MTNYILDLLRENKIQSISGVTITNSDSTKLIQIQNALREGKVKTVPSTEWQDAQQRRREDHDPNSLRQQRLNLKKHYIAVNLCKACYYLIWGFNQ